jgi:hypothetical protein
MIQGARAASIYCGITKDQAELQVKAFEEIHKDYRPTTSA